jgi:competence protein ComEC
MPLYDLAFYSALFFIFGIAAASLQFNLWLFLPLMAAAAFYLASPKAKYILGFSLVGFLGYFYFYFYAFLRPEQLILNQEIVFRGLVAREPVAGLKVEEADIRLLPPYQGEVRIYTDPSNRLAYGDLLEVKGTIEKSPTGRLNLAAFPEIKVVERNQGSPLRAFLFNLKGKMTANLKSALPPQEAALAAGILFGERAEFSPQFEEQMKLSGTTHIVALSGYNISIIGLTLAALLGYFFRRRWAFYAALGAIPLFVMMTGAEASVVRAGIMGIIVLLAEKQSRLYSFRNAVTLTAFLMLLVNPRLLLFDLGFQLSFAALLGIVHLYPWLKSFFRLRPDRGILGWRENLFQTLSAQLAVAPILLTKFGYFSATSLLANILILEFIPLTMFFGFLTALSGFLLYELSLGVGWITHLFLSYEILVIKFFSLDWL